MVVGNGGPLVLTDGMFGVINLKNVVEIEFKLGVRVVVVVINCL